MEMIRHEDIGVNLPARLGANLRPACQRSAGDPHHP
jgi:hypothetical protein